MGSVLQISNQKERYFCCLKMIVLHQFAYLLISRDQSKGEKTRLGHWLHSAALISSQTPSHHVVIVFCSITETVGQNQIWTSQTAQINTKMPAPVLSCRHSTFMTRCNRFQWQEGEAGNQRENNMSRVCTADRSLLTCLVAISWHNYVASVTTSVTVFTGSVTICLHYSQCSKPSVGPASRLIFSAKFSVNTCNIFWAFNEVWVK